MNRMANVAFVFLINCIFISRQKSTMKENREQEKQRNLDYIAEAYLETTASFKAANPHLYRDRPKLNLKLVKRIQRVRRSPDDK